METKQLIHRSMASTMATIFKYLPVITLTGPRQSGKTTLCHHLFPDLPYVNLENYSTLAAVKDDPVRFMSQFTNGVIIDEAQHAPEIISWIQVAVDQDRIAGSASRRFVITGSNNFSLMEKVTQSMAGRTAVLSLMPLSVHEICAHKGMVTTDELIFRGGYPEIWNSGIDARNILLDSYYSTYIERDVRSLLNVRDTQAFRTFIRLCASRIGCEVNASSLALEVGVKTPTIQHWLSILEASYIIYRVHPYYANIGKRLTKTPKMYFYDTGLASYLIGIQSIEHLVNHPLRGALFENLTMNEAVKYNHNHGKNELIYFYRDKSQREVDLLWVTPTGIDAYEIKSSQTYDSHFFKNLDYLEKILGNKVKRSMVIYDGEEENKTATLGGFCNLRSFSSVLAQS